MSKNKTDVDPKKVAKDDAKQKDKKIREGQPNSSVWGDKDKPNEMLIRENIRLNGNMIMNLNSEREMLRTMMKDNCDSGEWVFPSQELRCFRSSLKYSKSLNLPVRLKK